MSPGERQPDRAARSCSSSKREPPDRAVGSGAATKREPTRRRMVVGTALRRASAHPGKSESPVSNYSALANGLFRSSAVIKSVPRADLSSKDRSVSIMRRSERPTPTQLLLTGGWNEQVRQSHAGARRARRRHLVVTGPGTRARRRRRRDPVPPASRHNMAARPKRRRARSASRVFAERVHHQRRKAAELSLRTDRLYRRANGSVPLRSRR